MGLRSLFKKAGKVLRKARDQIVKVAPALALTAAFIPGLQPLALLGKVVSTATIAERTIRAVRSPDPPPQQQQVYAAPSQPTTMPEGYIEDNAKNRYLQTLVYAIVEERLDVADILWQSRGLAQLTVTEEERIRNLYIQYS